MATQTGVNIKRIAIQTEIEPGDYILIETPNGTRLIDYQDFVIGRDNISFDPLLSAFDTDIRNLSATLIDDVLTINTRVDEVSASIAALTDGTIEPAYLLLSTSLSTIESNAQTLQSTVDSITTFTDTLTSFATLDFLEKIVTLVSTSSAKWESCYTLLQWNSAAEGFQNHQR